MIVLGSLINNDTTLRRTWFKEMARLLGVAVKYYSPATIDYDIYGIQQILSELPTDMDIIYEEAPSIRTIKKLGWYKEGSEPLPIICHIPYDAEDLKVGCILGISPPAELIANHLSDTRIFKITEISSIHVYPEAWTCKLAPIISTTSYIDNSESDNFSYLNVDNFDDRIDQ